MHVSLNGFVGTQNGEINWINHDEAMFDFVATLTDASDTALYGRVTFGMMESYWPTAAEKPNATKHDIEHSAWYQKVEKIVISNTLKAFYYPNTKVIGNNLVERIAEVKHGDGKNILLLGSPRVFHALLNNGLIDETWLFVNPVLLGSGIPLFKGITETIKLNFLGSQTHGGGVVALHYRKV